MKKYSYIGISFIVLIFGIIVFPKIMDRIENQSMIQKDYQCPISLVLSNLMGKTVR